MIESKSWNWELVDKNSEKWNKPAHEMYYLLNEWTKNGFKDFLDVGCGFGRNAIFMAKNGFNVSAFDLSESCIQTALEKAKEQNVVLNICNADMLKMPYPDNSFDCLIAFNVISHTDGKGFKKILSEIKRILKPNGEAFFTVGSKDSASFKSPKNIPLDDCTIIKVEDGPENGIPHFYINDEDCKTLFNDFIIKEIRYVRQIQQSGKYSAQYFIWVKNNK